MIVHLDNSISIDLLGKVAGATDARFFRTDTHTVFVASSSVKSLPVELEPFVLESWVLDTDVQLSSRAYHPSTRHIALPNAEIGGTTSNTVVIAGPCAVESYEQMDEACKYLSELGVNTLRAGCFKPRTSPYSFQGLGAEGIEILVGMREKYGMAIVTEARDASNVGLVIDSADIVQIGTKSMFDYALLSACGDIDKPILLKRNYGATLREFLQCAEFIMSRGNEKVILCERGIRTFENNTRFTLDLCGVAWLKAHSSLPVVVDPSHAMGVAYGVPDLARAAVAMGVDGLLVETHPNPSVAKSDSQQQLDPNEFADLIKSVKPIAAAIRRRIV